MDQSQTFIANSAFKVEEFGNEILLYAVSTTKGMYLNETAYLVWEMCGKGHSVKDIIATLEDAYPQQKESISEDVLSTIESLVDSGAIHASNE